MSRNRFLTAEWRYLAMINYEWRFSEAGKNDSALCFFGLHKFSDSPFECFDVRQIGDFQTKSL